MDLEAILEVQNFEKIIKIDVKNVSQNYISMGRGPMRPGRGRDALGTRSGRGRDAVGTWPEPKRDPFFYPKKQTK